MSYTVFGRGDAIVRSISDGIEIDRLLRRNLVTSNAVACLNPGQKKGLNKNVQAFGRGDAIVRSISDGIEIDRF